MTGNSPPTSSDRDLPAPVDESAVIVRPEAADQPTRAIDRHRRHGVRSNLAAALLVVPFAAAAVQSLHAAEDDGCRLNLKKAAQLPGGGRDLTKLAGAVASRCPDGINVFVQEGHVAHLDLADSINLPSHIRLRPSTSGPAVVIDTQPDPNQKIAEAARQSRARAEYQSGEKTGNWLAWLLAASAGAGAWFRRRWLAWKGAAGGPRNPENHPVTPESTDFAASIESGVEKVKQKFQNGDYDNAMRERIGSTERLPGRMHVNTENGALVDNSQKYEGLNSVERQVQEEMERISREGGARFLTVLEEVAKESGRSVADMLRGTLAADVNPFLQLSNLALEVRDAGDNSLKKQGVEYLYAIVSGTAGHFLRDMHARGEITPETISQALEYIANYKTASSEEREAMCQSQLFGIWKALGESIVADDGSKKPEGDKSAKKVQKLFVQYLQELQADQSTAIPDRLDQEIIFAKAADADEEGKLTAPRFYGLTALGLHRAGQRILAAARDPNNAQTLQAGGIVVVELGAAEVTAADESQKGGNEERTHTSYICLLRKDGQGKIVPVIIGADVKPETVEEKVWRTSPPNELSPALLNRPASFQKFLQRLKFGKEKNADKKQEFESYFESVAKRIASANQSASRFQNLQRLIPFLGEPVQQSGQEVDAEALRLLQILVFCQETDSQPGWAKSALVSLHPAKLALLGNKIDGMPNATDLKARLEAMRGA